MRTITYIISSLTAYTLALTTIPLNVAYAATVSEPRIQHQAIHVDVTGPNANELDMNPNPFLDIRFDLTVQAPSGKQFIIPGFFAGDGQGGEQGTVWRAKFSPDEVGDWSYTAKLFSGIDASVQAQTNTLQDITRMQDQQGTFSVSSTQNNSENQSQPTSRGSTSLCWRTLFTV